MSISQLDSGMCIRQAFDDATQTLKVTQTGEFNVDIRASDGDTIMAVGTTDGTTSGTQKVIKVSATGVVSVDGSATTQPVSGTVTTVNSNNTRSDTFTAAANGTTVTTSTYIAKSFAIQVTGTAAAADAWNVVLEGSFDNVTFSTILTHASGSETNGQNKFSGSSFYPCKYFRSRCVSVTLGSATNLVVNIIGMD